MISTSDPVFHKAQAKNVPNDRVKRNLASVQAQQYNDWHLDKE